MHRTAVALVLLLGTFPLCAQSEIAPGIRLIRGTFAQGRQPDGNSIIFTTPTSLIVVDSGRHVEHTQSILDLAASMKLPIRTIINTHWHLDHIGGNARVRKLHPNVRIFASGALHEAREGFLTRYRAQLQEMIEKTNDAEGQAAFRAEVELIDAGPRLAPDVVIEKSQRLQIEGRRFQVGLEPYAVTAGDVWLFEERSSVLVAGDLVTLPVPFLDTACPQRWKQALDRLTKVDFELLIPGHGPPLTHRQFDVYRKAFDSLLTCGSSTADKKECIALWVDGVAELIPQDEHEFARNVTSYYVDVLRRSPTELAPLCGC